MNSVLKLGIASVISAACLISMSFAHSFVYRNDYKNATAPCSPILCINDTGIQDAKIAAKCKTIVDECFCYINEWRSPMYCPKLQEKKTLGFLYESKNRFLGFTCKHWMKQSVDSVARYLSRFLDIIVKWDTFDLSYCCRSGITMDMIKGKDFDHNISANRFSTLNVSHFPLIDWHVSTISFYGNCISNITGNFGSAFPKVKKINLNANFLTRIPNEIFRNLLYLDNLSLRNNRITEITALNFRDINSLTRLDLSHNQITHIASEAFDTLTNINIIELNNNKIKILPANIFQHNLNLIKIYIANNELSKLPATIFRENFKLEELYISSNKLTELPDDIFQGLAFIKHIFLKDNKLSHISSHLFAANSRIRIIDLSQNLFTELPSIKFTWRLNKPPDIKLFGNRINSIEIPLVPFIMQAQTLDISDNNITNIKESEFTTNASHEIIDNLVCKNCSFTSIPTKLIERVNRTANFTRNAIINFDMKTLTAIVHLKMVDLSYNLISRVDLNLSYPLLQDATQKIVNPETEIDLTGSRLECDCHLLPFLRFIDKDFLLPSWENRSSIRFHLNDVACKKPDALRGILVTYLTQDKELQSTILCNSTHKCPHKCNCYVRAVQQITVVNCSGKYLDKFPDGLLEAGSILDLHLENNLIQFLPEETSAVWNQIKKIHLRNNRLRNLKNLSVTSQLEELDVRNNLLTELSNVVNYVLKSHKNLSIFLSGNPWICNCELQKLRPILFSRGQVKDAERLSCLLPNEDNSVSLTSVTDEQLCPNMFYAKYLLRVLLPTFAVVAVLLFVCIIFGCRYKEEIKLWMFTHGICLRYITEEDIDGDKTYDAFVSYSSLDDQWVDDHLVPGLEQGNPCYKLCLHDRDWPAGEWIPDQIFESVQASRRTIIVLTDNFVESVWSRLEFHAAYRQALTDKVNRVLIVLPGSVPKTETLDGELRSFIRLNTYIKWSDPNFWRKLRCAMPKMHPELKKRHNKNSKNSTYC